MIEEISRLPLLPKHRTLEGDPIVEIAEITAANETFVGYVAGRIVTTDEYLVHANRCQKHEEVKVIGRRVNYLLVSTITKYDSLTVPKEICDVFG